MKRILLAVLAAALVMMAQAATTPIYLDESRPIEERVNDLLPRLTLDEKLAMRIQY